MKALLRYFVMKGLREHYNVTLLFAPSIMLVTPLLVLAVVNAFSGRTAWPPTLARHLSPAASADILTFPAILSAAIIATIAAFWVFRNEMTGRTIGFFFLAQHPAVPPLAAMLFGAAVGISSYAITILLLAVVTQAPMTFAAATALGALSSILFAAAVGTFAVGFSSETSMLIPTFVITFAAFVLIVEKRSTAFAFAAFAATIIIMLVAPIAWRRRCAR